MGYATAIFDGNGFARAAFQPGPVPTMYHRFLLRVFKVHLDNPGVRLFVVWDSTDAHERIRKFPSYKESRRKGGPFADLAQFHRQRHEVARSLLPPLGVHQAWCDGWEADDVIATLARSAETPVLVLTRDADLLQLVRTDVHVLLKVGSTECVFTPAEVRKQRGLDPELLTDWKALVGDQGDDVPGMEGVGEKVANEVLSRHPGLVCDLLSGHLLRDDFEEIVDDLRGNVKGSVATALAKAFRLVLHGARAPGHEFITAVERLRLMRWLVELHEVPVTIAPGRRDLATAYERFREFQLSKLRARLDEWT